MQVTVSVIIVNYNSGERLQKCLLHLEAQTFKDFEIIVIDNASDDDSIETAKLLTLQVQYILAKSNLGFAAANNLAVKSAEGTWLAFLNPDAYPSPKWLEELILATKRFPKALAFGSTQIDAAHPEILDGAGDVYHAWGIPYRGHFGWSVKRLPPEGECFSPCAAAALYKADTFRELGGFDERFFCYGEDVDLGFRLRLAGGRTVQVPSAIVKHEGSGVSGRHSDFTIYHGHRNRIWCAYKNTPFWLYWPLLPLHLFANLYLLFRAPFAGITRPYLKAMIAGYSGLSKFTKDRKENLSVRKASYKDLIKAMAWSPLKISRREGKVWPVK